MIKITISHYTKYDMKAVYSTAGNNPLKLKVNIIFILIFAVMLIISFIMPENKLWFCLFILLAVSIISFVNEMWTAPANALRTFSTLQKHHDNLPICVCFDKNFWYTSFGDNAETLKKFDYISTYGAEETENYFFMSQQKNEHFCIPKRCFTENNTDELRQFLTNRLGNKFKTELRK